MVNNKLPSPIFIDSEKGSKLALYRYKPISSVHPPIILTHGTFSNAVICQKLAGYLYHAGFDCWIYEWSGHGLSEYGNLTPDAEDHALNDVPSVIKKVKAETHQKTVIWVAHSGGGFMPLMYIARNLHLQKEVQALVALGSQTTGAGKTLGGKMRIIASMMAIKFWGRVPGRYFGLGPEDEYMGFMPQWCRWNWNGEWSGKDGFNYLKAMESIHIPSLFFAGTRDIIAPHYGCYELFSSLSSSVKKYILCGQRSGFFEDYTHSRLIASQNSQKEIWPKILAFIESAIR